MSKYIISKLDNQEYCVSNGQFARHLRTYDLSYKEYYEIYVTGITPLCSCLRPCTFYQARNEYAATCGSQRCSKHIISNNRTQRSSQQISAEKQNRIDAHLARSPNETHSINKKRQITNQKVYGTNTPAENSGIKQQTRQKFIDTYGVAHPMKLPHVKAKAADAINEKYGVTSWAKLNLSDVAISILDDRTRFEEEMKKLTTLELANQLGCDRTIIYDRIQKYNLTHFLVNESYLEREMSQLLNDMGVSYIKNTRSIIQPKELDFYLPDHNVAIEMNGDYWHSDIHRDRHYHYNKWKECDNRGIHLIQILETDWNNNRHKFEKMLTAILRRKSTVVGARKLSVNAISNSLANDFLNTHHLQGMTVSTTSYGAFNDLSQLVAVMTFGWTRGSRENRNFELKRWVTDAHNSYPGAFSKVFKFAQKDLAFDQVVSFSMNDWFNGNMYAQTGFVLEKVLPPAYKYYYDDKWQHCSYFTKSSIRKKLGHVPDVLDMLDAGKTEFAVINHIGIMRTWDSGKKRWIWHK